MIYKFFNGLPVYFENNVINFFKDDIEVVIDKNDKILYCGESLKLSAFIYENDLNAGDLRKFIIRNSFIDHYICELLNKALTEEISAEKLYDTIKNYEHSKMMGDL